MLPVALITVTVGLTRDFIRFLKDNEERKLKIREKSVVNRKMKVEPLENGINEDTEKVPYPFGHEIRWPWYRKIQVKYILFKQNSSACKTLAQRETCHITQTTILRKRPFYANFSLRKCLEINSSL